MLWQGNAARGHPSAGRWGATKILTNHGDCRDGLDQEHPRVVAGSRSGCQDGCQNPRLQVRVCPRTKSHHAAGHPFFARAGSTNRPYRLTVAGIATHQRTQTPPISAPSRSRTSSSWSTSSTGFLSDLTVLTEHFYRSAGFAWMTYWSMGGMAI